MTIRDYQRWVIWGVISGVVLVAGSLGANGCSRGGPLPGGSDDASEGDSMTRDASAVDSMSRDASGGDALAGDAGAPVCPPAEVASTVDVTMRVHNGLATDRLVSTSSGGFGGDGWCMRYGVSHAGEALPLQMGFQCGCECPGPGPVYSNSWHRVKPGETYDLGHWYGRSLALCTTTESCDPPWKGHPPVKLLSGAERPLPPGDYLLRVAVERQPPMNCSSSNNDVDYICHQQGFPGNPAPNPGPTEDLCPSTMVSTQKLTLPAQGTLVVTVELN